MSRGRRPLTEREAALVRSIERKSDALKEMRKNAWEVHRQMIERELDAARVERDEAVREAAALIGMGGGMSAAAIKRALGTTDHSTYRQIIAGAVQKPWRLTTKGGKAHLTRFLNWDVSIEFWLTSGGELTGKTNSVPEDMEAATNLTGSPEYDQWSELLTEIKEALR